MIFVFWVWVTSLSMMFSRSSICLQISRCHYLFLGIYPKDDKSYQEDMCSTVFIAALFVIARIWKQPKCPSTEEWIRKMKYIYTMEYYTAEKNSDILNFAGKWMELENIILSEVTQTQKDKYHMYSLINGF